MNLALIIPTLNGGENFVRLIAELRSQSIYPDTIVIIDSGSTDATLTIAEAAEAKVHIIESGTFNHGATRDLGRKLIEADFYIYMTQDAIPANTYTLEKLVRPMIENEEVSLVYGRQLPRPGAGPIEAFSRLFNYPAVSQIKRIVDADRLGVKTVFCSNACAAYRREALDLVGGFPKKVIISEDVYVAARMMEAGFSIFYAADAMVYHSHEYSIIQELRRYFDLGVYYESQNRWIVETFGRTGKEGAKFFWGGLRYLNDTKNLHFMPEWFIRTIAKLFAYKLGAKEKYLPRLLKYHLSMHKKYW